MAVCLIAYICDPKLFKDTTFLTIVEYCFILAVPTFWFWIAIIGGFFGNNEKETNNHGNTAKQKLDNIKSIHKENK